jgi:hypothetical protein
MILLLVVWRVLFCTAVNGQGMYIHVTYQVPDLDSIDFELMSMFANKNERSYPPEFLSFLYLLAYSQQFVEDLVSLFYHRSIRSKMHKELSKVLLSQFGGLQIIPPDKILDL